MPRLHAIALGCALRTLLFNLFMKEKSKYPPGWDEARVTQVLAHYEAQTEEEAVAEDEAAFEDRTQTTMEVPQELVPAVRELIAKHKTKPTEQSPD
jgi:hypothetical protein